MLEVFLDRHLLSLSMWRPGEGNVRYYYFGVSSNFRRFNFRHAVAVRKFNPFENNRLYSILYNIIVPQ